MEEVFRFPMCICAAPRTPFEGVTVYGRHDSREYEKLSSFFEDRGVLFEFANVAEQPNRQRMVDLSGQEEAVVIEIGRKIFVGFTPAELERALP
jgi:hypothetical protein